MIRKLLFVVFITCPIFLFANDLFVDYLDGYLDIEINGQWEPLYIGDEIGIEDTIRITDNSYAEFLSGNTRITLDKDGVYHVEDLVSHTASASKWGLKGTAITKLFKDDELESRSGAVMGVRGDPQDEETITWVDDDVEFLDEGKDLYYRGLYEDALMVLEEGAEWYGSNFDEIMMYKALCEYETGDRSAMRYSLDEMDPDPMAEYFGDYVLFKGNILIESRDYEDAVDLFDYFINEADDLSIEQEVVFLSAFCFMELGDERYAVESLERVVEINAFSELGRQASALLKDM